MGDFSSIDFFGLSAPSMHLSPPMPIQRWLRGRGPVAAWVINASVTVWLWHLFNRTYADGRGEAGAGLLQINRRHLLYVGLSREDDAVVWRFCLCFLWLIGRAP